MHKFMKQSFTFIFLSLVSFCSFAQVTDSSSGNKVLVHQDYRMEILARKEADINTAILKAQARIANGYRLMILNTNDRAYAMKVRGELLQKYPDQKTDKGVAKP